MKIKNSVLIYIDQKIPNDSLQFCRVICSWTFQWSTMTHCTQLSLSKITISSYDTFCTYMSKYVLNIFGQLLHAYSIHDSVNQMNTLANIKNLFCILFCCSFAISGSIWLRAFSFFYFNIKKASNDFKFDHSTKFLAIIDTLSI